MPHIYVPDTREVIEAVAAHSMALAIFGTILFNCARTRHPRHTILMALFIGSVGGVLACFAIDYKSALSLFGQPLEFFFRFTLPIVLVSPVLPIAAGFGMFASWISLMLYGAAREHE